jgi:NADPH-dependent curcumin reductase CurA
MSSDLPTSTREIRLAARPEGEPTPDTFEISESTLPALEPGQVLIRNTWLSVDPYMRGRMDEGGGFAGIPPYEVGAPLDGGALGEVIASHSDGIAVGDTVVHFLGWREYAVVDAAAATPVDTDLAPASAYLGVLGTTGLTAWASLTDVAPVGEGDVVFVSAAAGATGSVAGQFARRLGASRVVGSAGGPDKAKLLVTDLGYDAALDYKAGPLEPQLREAAPEGIDVYLDLVGGDHLQAAISSLRLRGRVAVVGAIGEYNATTPVPGPTNLYDVARKELTLRGMVVASYYERFPEYIAQAAAWLADGLHTRETVRYGLDQAPGAFIEMLRGGNVGKMLVRLDG